MLQKDAFGEFQLEIARFQSSFPEYSTNAFEKILIPELDRRRIRRQIMCPKTNGLHLTVRISEGGIV